VKEVEMRKKRLTAILMIAVLLLLMPFPAAGYHEKRDALRGLKGVNVFVYLNAEAERLGLIRDQVKTDVELRLRKAGIKVLIEKESFETPGVPTLWVAVDMIISDIYVFNVRVHLREEVKLARGFYTFGEIWEGGVFGAIRTGNIRKIRESVGDEVDEFINDYLAVNPKKQDH
jgi:hypothetical protein